MGLRVTGDMSCLLRDAFRLLSLLTFLGQSSADPSPPDALTPDFGIFSGVFRLPSPPPPGLQGTSRPLVQPQP